MKRSTANLMGLVESYFQEHLRRVRGASPHTVHAYRDTLQIFFGYVADHTRRPMAKLTLDDIHADVVLAFLDHLESARHNTAATRNCRLVAIRGFVQHLLRHDVSRAARYQRILGIPTKKSRTKPVSYLEPEEMKVVLAQPERNAPGGLRDHALLLFLYNTGARVSEALAVRPRDLQLFRPPQVRLHGKGSKERLCPLWDDTAAVLKQLIRKQHDSAEPLFRNAGGNPLTRHGVAYLLSKYVRAATHHLPSLHGRQITPHTLRHSCAVALLQAGVDVTVIRDYLGHASIATTSRYITTNLQTRRDTLEKFWKRAGLTPSPEARWKPSPGLLDFLAKL